MTEEHTRKRKRYREEDTVILEKVSERIITKETLKEKLAEHVEQVLHQSNLILSFHRTIIPFVSAEFLLPVMVSGGLRDGIRVCNTKWS